MMEEIIKITNNINKLLTFKSLQSQYSDLLKDMHLYAKAENKNDQSLINNFHYNCIVRMSLILKTLISSLSFELDAHSYNVDKKIKNLQDERDKMFDKK